MSHVMISASDAQFRKHLKRADLYFAAGQQETALGSLMAAIEANPDHVETRLRVADIHIAAQRHNPAREQILRALSGHIESPRVAVALVRRLNVISESATIIEIAKQLPLPMWDSASSLAEMATQLTMVGAHELADEFAKGAVAREPTNPLSLSALAKMDVFYGRFGDAASHAEACLSKVPDDPGTHWLLSRLRLPQAGQRVERIQALIDRTTEQGALASLGYALHNELHDLGDHERAWGALELACAAKRAKLRYDPGENARLFDALQTWTGEEASIIDGHVDTELRPIFVVGMHRSGTTLTERILTGHSQVAAGGETYDITAALRRASGFHCLLETDARIVSERAGFDYRRIGREYLQSMRWRAAGKAFITDKLPSNFLNIGFILRALPEARVIRLRRDPIDVGLSNLRTLFSQACPYSYDQQEFIDYFRRFEGLMAHWHAVFPQRILDVDYHDLVSAPEAVSRRIADYCGLEFEPSMVQIEKRDDAVATASSVMMRDGIRKDRGRVWKVYERQLQPLIQALGQQPA